MGSIVLIEGFAVLAQLPMLSALLRRPARRDLLFWLGSVVACVAAMVVTAVLMSHGWQSGFVATSWTTLAGMLAVYLCVAAWTPEAWRLAPLVGMYATVAGGLSFVMALATGEGETPPASLPPAWFAIHVGMAVITYALVTLSAIAALAASIQDRAVKTKRPTRLSRLLPSIAGCEALSLRLLTVGVAVLAAGLVTGVAMEYLLRGGLPPMNHKTVLTLAAFFVLVALLAAHFGTGMRGRRAARGVLLGYLLLALGYPGVKFVTDVLLP